MNTYETARMYLSGNPVEHRRFIRVRLLEQHLSRVREQKEQMLWRRRHQLLPPKERGE